METLKELIQMGFSPMIALVIVAVMVLWGSLCAVVVFMYRAQVRERNQLAALREEWHEEVEERLNASEEKHQECEDDRSRLRSDVESVKFDLDRMKRCPRANCPMRLPP